MVTYVPVPKSTGPGGKLQQSDLDKYSLVEGDYSLGLVPFCPVHGVNIHLLHNDRRCAPHNHKIYNIAAKKDKRVRETDQRQAQKAWVHANGVQMARRGANGKGGPAGPRGHPSGSM